MRAKETKSSNRHEDTESDHPITQDTDILVKIRYERFRRIRNSTCCLVGEHGREMQASQSVLTSKLGSLTASRPGVLFKIIFAQLLASMTCNNSHGRVVASRGLPNIFRIPIGHPVAMHVVCFIYRMLNEKCYAVMPPLLERSSDVETQPMLPRSENSAPIDIDLLDLNV